MLLMTFKTDKSSFLTGTLIPDSSKKQGIKVKKFDLLVQKPVDGWWEERLLATDYLLVSLLIANNVGPAAFDRVDNSPFAG